MKITSPDFKDGGQIPMIYTCDGLNYNPRLNFEEVPLKTKSLALIMDDHDVPKHLIASGVFDHWIVYNIAPDCTGIKENSGFDASYGLNGAGKSAYTGPCPPDREHRYNFKLLALDCKLDLKNGATKNEVEAAAQDHVIEEALLIGRYARV